MTSRDPLRTTDSILTSATTTGLASVWGKMDTSPLLAKSFMFDISTLMPGYNKLMSPLFTDISKTMKTATAMAYPMEQMAGIQKMIIEASGVHNIAKVFMDSHTEMMRGLYPSFNVISSLGLNEQLQSLIAELTKSLAAAIDTSYLNSILASAGTFRDELADQDLEELTDDFFENHPDLAESIEEIPALYTLSKADRTLVIWFVRLCVTMSFTCIMLNLSVENQELDAIIDALGISGGWAAGKKAGELTGKALERLPHEGTD